MERSGPKIQMSGTVGKNERSAEREERERSGEQAESAAHAAKSCTICNLHFSEAKRGPGLGTSRLDFGGNPMTFFSLPHFHPDDQSWSLCNSRPYIEHCRIESTVYTMSQKRRRQPVIFDITLSTSNQFS